MPRIILSLVSGLLLALSFPHIGNLSLVMLIAFVPLLMLEEQVSSKKLKSYKVFFHAYLTFLIYNVATTWWIWNADSSGAMLAFILNSLLMAIAFQLFHFVKKHVGRREGYISLIFIWISFEYAHYHWDLSWPWLNLGNAFANTPELVQWYSYSGVLGGTLWILICNIIVFSIINNIKQKKESVGIQTPLFLLLAVAVIFPISFSLISYINYEEKSNPINVIVTQPNIDTYKEKWTLPVKYQLESCFSNTDVKFDESDLILAPETAISMDVFEPQLKKNKAYQFLLDKAQEYNRPDIFIGMGSFDVTKEKKSGSRPINGGKLFRNNYNSGLLVTNTDQPAISHKSELVLGVEKLPFTNIFPFIEKWAMSMGGASGTLVVPEQLANIQTKNAIIAPAICYESVYGNTCAEFTNKGAEIITIITNDDWWHDTPGHRQHFDFARLRAIENRRAVARSANTGVSGFINQRGDIIVQSNYKEHTALQLGINKNIEKTFYTKYGDFLGRIFAFATVLILIFGIVKKIRNRAKLKS